MLTSTPAPRRFRRLAFAAAWCALAAVPAIRAARTPTPAIHLNLADLGVPSYPQALQSSGAVLVTAHFVDTTHLLVTYGLRGLVERIPGDPPEHNDRAVAALLVELPTGKVLARARWHLHDYNRFLWPLGDGRFLLRNESRLVTIAPLRNLPSGDAFHQMPFIRANGVVEAIFTSPEGDLITVEVSPIRKRLPKPSYGTSTPSASTQSTSATPPPSPPADEDEDRPRGPVDVLFFRVAGEGTVDDPLIAISSGQLKSSSVGFVPLNGRGILSARSRRRDSWTAQYNSYDGETRKLAEIASSCPPLLQFLGPSNYLAFTCRGAADRITVTEYNFLQHEMWEEPMPGTQPFGIFAFSPRTGRFAMSRLVTLSTNPNSPAAASLTSDTGFSTSQDVRVYQSESGDLLLKLVPSPTSPSGQNFDLSTDGMSFLIINNGFIDIYRLPALTPQDTADLASLATVEPPAPKSNFISIRQTLRRAAEDVLEPVPAVVGEPMPGMTVATTIVPPPTPTENVIANGDSQAPRRKPPTLLQPGEKPEFAEKKKKSDPTKE